MQQPAQTSPIMFPPGVITAIYDCLLLVSLGLTTPTHVHVHTYNITALVPVAGHQHPHRPQQREVISSKQNITFVTLYCCRLMIYAWELSLLSDFKCIRQHKMWAGYIEMSWCLSWINVGSAQSSALAFVQTSSERYKYRIVAPNLTLNQYGYKLVGLSHEQNVYLF